MCKHYVFYCNERIGTDSLILHIIKQAILKVLLVSQESSKTQSRYVVQKPFSRTAYRNIKILIAMKYPPLRNSIILSLHHLKGLLFSVSAVVNNHSE